MRSLKLRICYHEAAHCAAALQLGIPVIRVTANSPPHMRRDPRYQPDTPARARRLTLLSLAGPMAEERFCGVIDDGGSDIDYEKARGYLALWLAPSQVEGELVRLTDEAKSLVRKRWARRRIRLLAAELLVHGTLSGEEILRLIAGEK
jgi:hypothetical protein